MKLKGLLLHNFNLPINNHILHAYTEKKKNKLHSYLKCHKIQKKTKLENWIKSFMKNFFTVYVLFDPGQKYN